MSTDWHVRCVDCNDTHQFSDANHMSSTMAQLCKHAAAIASLAPLFEERDADWLIRFSVGDHGSIDPAWFAAHAGHQLVPIDEYGNFLGQCTEYVACVCGSSRRCTRDHGHDGDHAVEPKP